MEYKKEAQQLTDKKTGIGIYPIVRASDLKNDDGTPYVLPAQLRPSGTDISTNILEYVEDKGIYIGNDTGHWYYWNGSAYADGGVYQATEVADGSINANQLTDSLKSLLGIDTETVDLGNSNLDQTLNNQYWGSAYTLPVGSTLSSITLPNNTTDNNTFDLWIYQKQTDGTLKYVTQLLSGYKLAIGSNTIKLNYEITQDDLHIIFHSLFNDAVSYSLQSGTTNLWDVTQPSGSSTNLTIKNDYAFALGIQLEFVTKTTEEISINYTQFDEETQELLGINPKTIKLYNVEASALSNGLDNSTYGIGYPLAKGTIIKSVTLDKSGNRSNTVNFYLYQKTDTNYVRVAEIGSGFMSTGTTLELNYTVNKDNCYIFYKSADIDVLIYSANAGTSDYDMLLGAKNNGDPTPISSIQKYKFGVSLSLELLNVGSAETKPSNIITVAKDGSGDYTTINDALSYAYTIESASNPITIMINPGVYEEVLFIQGKHYISLIGKNRNDCIIKDETALYNNAPLRIQGQCYIANLTFISNADKYVSSTHGTGHEAWVQDVVDGIKNPEWLGTIGSYAVHCDDVTNGEDTISTFINCRMYSETFPAFGSGMQLNNHIELLNCELVSNIDARVKASGNGQGTLLIHGNFPSSPVAEPNQSCFVKDCYIEGIGSRVLNMYPSTNAPKANIVFINNTFKCDSDDAYSFTFDQQYIDKCSHGNNLLSFLNKAEQNS